MGRPALRKDAVDYMTSHWGISQRRACRLIKQPRSNQHYCRRKDPRNDLSQHIPIGNFEADGNRGCVVVHHIGLRYS